MQQLPAADRPRFPSDEFEHPRARQETHPTLASYLTSRTVEELGALTWNGIYQRNVFGSYPGTVDVHSRAILDEIATRAASPMRLEWKISDEGRYAAETPFGAYTIHWNGKRAELHFGGELVGKQDYDLERAQSMAQGNFDARVASCLGAAAD